MISCLFLVEQQRLKVNPLPLHCFPQYRTKAHHLGYHKRKKEAEQARREAAKNAPPPPPRKNCPLADGMNTDCTNEKCALYLNGCTLARLTDRPPAKATEGLQCPLSKYRFKCRTDCALYNKTGCTLTAIKTESEDNNEQI